MSCGATVKQTSRVIELVQDVEALERGFSVLNNGLILATAQEIARGYGARCDGKHAFYRDYNNQNMTANEIKNRMEDKLNRSVAGFNAEFVIRHQTDDRMFQVGLVRNEAGKLQPVCDLYNTGRGLAPLLMSKKLMELTKGHLHGTEYPDEAFERISQAQVLGRTILDLERQGLIVEQLETEDRTQPSFAVRMDTQRHVDFTVEQTGQMHVQGQGFEGQSCTEPMNRLMSLLNRQMEDIHAIDDHSVEPIRVPEVVTN